MVQMDALRAVLLAFDQHNLGPTARATAQGLSETVNRVTAEAEAAALAHRELQDDEIAALLGRALPAPQAGTISPAPVAPRTQPVAQPVQPAQQQTVGGAAATSTSPTPSRKWWRNP
jgi:hypothetical protein